MNEIARCSGHGHDSGGGLVVRTDCAQCQRFIWPGEFFKPGAVVRVVQMPAPTEQPCPQHLEAK